LDAIRDPQLRQIIVVDAPAVLGLARFTELDEQLAAPRSPMLCVLPPKPVWSMSPTPTR
jgi:hypothetical protein